MLDWSKQFSILLLLDSNGYTDQYSRYACLLAVNAVDTISSGQEDGLENLNRWHELHHDWLFGHICYDYKNVLEKKLSSRHAAKHNYAPLHFFCPEIVCYINPQQSELSIESLGPSPDEVFEAIRNSLPFAPAPLPSLKFQQRTERGVYLQTIKLLRQHIYNGDCYEINHCNEGFCEEVSINPPDVFHRLITLSPAPFAAYYRLHKQYMMCASPERYLYKNGKRIVSQPIKGTARRGENAEEDCLMKKCLRKSIKEQAENVMIVDLTRNDLARSCETGSVKVDELFGIYTFPQVHQMISTVSGTLRADMQYTEALRYSFPMGSMTGAPKVKVMQLIDECELSRRELFSGTVGYITPDADFDFNVIIRSLFYNETTRYLSYQTGGAITYDSDPLQEWEEMRLKAWALERIFS